jgi:hypothetical protein
MNKCEHKNKAYNPVQTTLTSYPAIHIQGWICKDCGFEGEDRTTSIINADYQQTKDKFGKSSNVTFTS